MSTYNLTVSPNHFSSVCLPVEVSLRQFDGKRGHLEEVLFKDPRSGEYSFQSAASINMFTQNGTMLLTPSAVNQESDLGIKEVQQSQLEGKLLVLELQRGIAYDDFRLRELLQHQNILNHRDKANGKYLILLKTGLMDPILGITDEDGIPDQGMLERIQASRPGITLKGAEYLAKLNLAKAYLIDNISIEVTDAKADGFPATQILMSPDTKGRTFVPLVYHVANTSGQEFKRFVASGEVSARIELGNFPYTALPSYPVAVRLYKP